MDRVKTLQQEIFNEVWAGASAQNFIQSMNEEDGGCAYRGQNGCRCNVGHLIPDDGNTAEIEGDNINNDAIFKATTAFERAIAANFAEDEVQEIRNLLYVLQDDHDNAADAAEHKARLLSTARDYKLEVLA